MLKQLLPQSELLIISNSTPCEAVEYISSYIKDYSCEILSIDISSMNVLDACYVTTLCATEHYIKYPNGKITWIVSSELVKDFNKDLELGTNCYIL